MCRLMSGSDSLFTTGFNDWRKSHEKIEARRSSPQHRNSVSAAILRNKLTTVDKHLVDELEREIAYWHAGVGRVEVFVRTWTSDSGKRRNDRFCAQWKLSWYRGVVVMICSLFGTPFGYLRQQRKGNHVGLVTYNM